MFERVIFDVIKDGIAAYTKDRTYIERLFRHEGLSATETVRLRDLFQRLPPSVIHSYPRDDSIFPLYAIVLGEEQETTKFLNDSGGLLEDAEFFGEAVVGNELKASIYTAVYHVYVVTDAPDVTLAYYAILRNLLTLKREVLVGRGAIELRFAGSDIVPELRYLPAYLFFRRFTITCQLEDHAVFGKNEAEGRVREVRGIHVNDGFTSPDALGGVPTLITPYTEET